MSPTTVPAPEVNERHMATFGNFDMPRQIGSVDNAGLELPAISPDGEQLLYLRTDQEGLSPMTRLGSSDPQDTPAEGNLTIWLRPVEGNGLGQQLSTSRWCHSAVWSPTGRAVAFVSNEPPGSSIICVDMTTGQQRRLGLSNAVNCLTRFAKDGHTLLYCSGPTAKGPFRVYKQDSERGEPVGLTPEGTDCLLPLAMPAPEQIWCAEMSGQRFDWVAAGPAGATELVPDAGPGRRPAILQTWAGITEPLSPDGRSWMFYDSLQNRLSIYHAEQRRVVRHRLGSIAGCWLDNDSVALVTSNAIFVVNTVTGISPELFNGTWVPARYVPRSHRLLLFGRENSRQLSIVEVVFKPRAT